MGHSGREFGRVKGFLVVCIGRYRMFDKALSNLRMLHCYELVQQCTILVELK